MPHQPGPGVDHTWNQVRYVAHTEPIPGRWIQVIYFLESPRKAGTYVQLGFEEIASSQEDMDHELRESRIFSLEHILKEEQILFVTGEREIWAAHYDKGPADPQKEKVGVMPIAP